MTAAAQKRTSSRCVTMTEASGSGPGRAESLVAAESEAPNRACQTSIQTLQGAADR